MSNGRGPSRRGGRSSSLLTSLLCAALTDTNIDVGSDCDELLECASGSSGVHQLIFDGIRKVVVEPVSKISPRVPCATSKLAEASSILWDREGALPELAKAFLRINGLVYRLKASLELSTELVPVIVERGVPEGDVLHCWSGPQGGVVLHVREDRADPLIILGPHCDPIGVQPIERGALGHGPHGKRRKETTSLPSLFPRERSGLLHCLGRTCRSSSELRHGLREEGHGLEEELSRVRGLCRSGLRSLCWGRGWSGLCLLGIGRRGRYRDLSARLRLMSHDRGCGWWTRGNDYRRWG